MNAPQPAPPGRFTAPHHPGRQAHPGSYGQPRAVPPRTNALSIVALIAAFAAPIVGLVLGLVARRRIRRTGEHGRGLATTSVLLGSLFSLAWVAVIVTVLTVGSFQASFSTTPSVPTSSVQTQIESLAGLPTGSVTCPDPLPATVGAATTCTATVDGRPTPIDATVTTVDGSDVGFRITSR